MTSDKERSDKESARALAMQIVDNRLCELAANILRVVRGAGRSYEIGHQALGLINAMVAYREAVGHFPDSESLDAALGIEIPNERLNRMRDDEEMDVSARQAIIRGALQVAASRLLGQRTQEAAGDTEMFEGARDLEKVREERRKHWAEMKRPPQLPKERR